MPENRDIRSEYLREVFENLPALVDRWVGRLEPHKSTFDAVVFRGMSGALVAPLIAVRLGKPFVLVRKEGDGSHSTLRVEGDKNFKTYIIIDDLIASGGTVEIIQEQVHEWNGAVCMGLALWYYGAFILRDSDHYYRRYFRGYKAPAPPPLPDHARMFAQQNTCMSLEQVKATPGCWQIGIDMSLGEALACMEEEAAKERTNRKIKELAAAYGMGEQRQKLLTERDMNLPNPDYVCSEGEDAGWIFYYKTPGDRTQPVEALALSSGGLEK